MFFEKYVNLCNGKGLSPSAAAKEIGFSNAAASGWKKGAPPRGANLQKIANFFDVPVEYFDEETDDRGQKKNPAQMDGAGVDDELRRIWDAASDDERGLILDMARMVRDRGRKGE